MIPGLFRETATGHQEGEEKQEQATDPAVRPQTPVCVGWGRGIPPHATEIIKLAQEKGIYPRTFHEILHEAE